MTTEDKPMDPEEKLEDFVLETVSCHRCKFCITTPWPELHSICPAYEKYGWFAYSGGGKVTMVKQLAMGTIKWMPEMMDIVFACTTCGACAELCYTNLRSEFGFPNLVDLIEAMRACLLKFNLGPPSKLKVFGEHMGREHNPYVPESHKERLAWLPSGVKLPEKSETVFFVGCTSSYRQKNLAKATIEVFQKVGVDFTILKDEWCCTSPILRTGQWETPWVSAKEIAQHNVGEAAKVGAKRIVTTCAGCYRTWKLDYMEAYEDVLEAKHDFEIIHTMELLEKLMKKGEIEFKNELKMNVTYHDPCHIGRHTGLYDSPRNVLRQIPGIELVEMERTREHAWCCGAGGGVKSGYSELAMWSAGERIKEAESLGVDAIVSACPFCWRNIDDALKSTNSKLKMYDVIELVNQAIE